MYATEREYIKIITKLIKYKANINIQDKYGWSALMIASNNNYLNIVNLLLKGNNNLQNNFGETALIISSENGYLTIVKKLLEYNISINLKNNNNNTAYIKACKNNYKNIAIILKIYRKNEIKIILKKWNRNNIILPMDLINLIIDFII